MGIGLTNEPTPQLSIVIVAWNVADLVLQCLDSIERTASGLSHEIILVDNASSDDVVVRVQARYPAVRIIRNEQNVGFPRANNQALPFVRGKYLLYLNPDTQVRENTLVHCVNVFERDPRVGVVGCRLEFPDGTLQYECARKTFRLQHLVAEMFWFHVLFPRNRWFGDHRMSWWDHRDSREVEAVSGAFLMVRADLARKVGGLPEDIFMYHEDLSFCLRVRRLGYGIHYAGGVVTTHYAGQSSQRSKLWLELLEHEAKLLLISEAQGYGAWLCARGVMLLTGLVRLPVAAIGLLLPRRIHERFPRAFQVRRHLVQMLWAVAPFTLSHLLPRAPELTIDPQLAAGVT